MLNTAEPTQNSQATRATPQNTGVRSGVSAFLVSLIALAAVFAVVFLLPTDHDKKSFFAICVDKHKQLKATRSPRLILTGGSNITLGVDTELLERRLQTPVVSTSSNILLGLDYMLHEIQNDLQQGDTVVVIPEYEHWLGEYYGSEALLMMPSLMPESALWVVPSYYRKGFDYLRFGKHFHSAAKERFKRLLGMSDKVVDGDFRMGGAFNQRCDFVQHLDLQPTKFDLLDKNLADLSAVDPYCFKKFNAFVETAKSKGATVIVMPPVTTETFCKSRRSQLDKFWQTLSSNLKCLVVTDYARQSLPDAGFWDCKYHPLRLGREQRTNVLGAQLTSLLKKN